MKLLKKSKSTTLLTMILLSMLTISACSNASNPLTKASQHDAGVFLANASLYAQKALKWDEDKYGAGGSYGACMDGKVNDVKCNALYEKMLAYAKTQKAFKVLTKDELTNANTYAKLKDAYQGAAFNLLPY